jgi:hypothetical protein
MACLTFQVRWLSIAITAQEKVVLNIYITLKPQAPLHCTDVNAFKGTINL